LKIPLPLTETLKPSPAVVSYSEESCCSSLATACTALL
jgi:hypothetical protein